MPDYANAPVTWYPALRAADLVLARRLRHPSYLRLQAGGSQRLLQCHIDSVELVVTCHLFGKSASSLILEDNKVLDKIEKPAPVEDAFEHDPQLGHLGVGQGLAGDRTPRFEPLPAGRECPDPCLDTVRDHQQLVEDEQRG